MRRCVLCQFPDEVKLHIWRYLSSTDIINIESKNIFNCNCTRNVSCEKNLIRKLDCAGAYNLCFADLKLFVQLRRSLITHLDISFAYWVPKSVIISAVIQMNELQCLNALDTKLHFDHLEELERKDSKVGKVSVSIHTVPKYIKWKVICELNILFYYTEKANDFNLHDCYRKLNRGIKTSKGLLVHAIDERIEVYSSDTDMMLQGYEGMTERKRYNSTHIMSRHGKSIYICYCHVVGDDATCPQNKIKGILDKFPDTDELYVRHCCMPALTDGSLRNKRSSISNFDNNIILIANLKNLKILTLEMLQNFPGTFFEYVLNSCKNLQTLRVRIGYCLPLLKKIYLALRLSTSLKTLCLKYDHVIDNVELMSVLLKCPFKLDRLVIDSSDIRNFSEKDINRFFIANAQLKFVYFVIKKMPQVAVRNVQKIFNSFSVGDPQRIYKISAELSLKYGREVIPAIHYLEAMNFQPKFSSSYYLHHWLPAD